MARDRSLLLSLLLLWSACSTLCSSTTRPQRVDSNARLRYKRTHDPNVKCAQSW